MLALLGAAGLFAAGGLPNLPVQEKPTGRLLPFTPAAILLAAVFGLWSLSEDMVYAMLEILAVQNVGLSPGQSSVVISLQIIGGLTGAVVAPLVLARIGRSLSIFGILVLSSTAKFLIVSSTAAPVFLAANVAWGWPTARPWCWSWGWPLAWTSRGESECSSPPSTSSASRWVLPWAGSW